MARFAIIVPPLTGHINPTLSLGSELLRAGHEVGWISIDPSLREKLPEGGLLLLINYQETDQRKKEGENYLNIISRRSVYGIDSIKFLYEEVLVPLNRYMFDGIDDWLDDFSPDLVITDHQMFAGAIAATKRNIPYATSVTAPAAIKVMSELPKVHEWEKNQIVALQQELGVAGDECLDCSALLTLVFTSKTFFGEMELPGCFKFVGPVMHNRPETGTFDWEAFHRYDRPKVLVSIGTTFDHEQKQLFFLKVIDAFREEPFTVVLVSDPALFTDIPDNFIVQKRIPQVALLPHLQAVVCHGGNNTVCETLSHGLPLVVIPIAYDQSHVAGRVARVEAGLRLNFNRFKAHHLREALREVLQQPKYSEGAQRIQASFEQAGGVQQAVQLLEAAIPARPSVENISFEHHTPIEVSNSLPV